MRLHCAYWVFSVVIQLQVSIPPCLSRAPEPWPLTFADLSFGLKGLDFSFHSWTWGSVGGLPKAVQ